MSKKWVVVILAVGLCAMAFYVTVGVIYAADKPPAQKASKTSVLKYEDFLKNPKDYAVLGWGPLTAKLCSLMGSRYDADAKTWKLMTMQALFGEPPLPLLAVIDLWMANSPSKTKLTADLEKVRQMVVNDPELNKISYKDAYLLDWTKPSLKPIKDAFLELEKPGNDLQCPFVHFKENGGTPDILNNDTKSLLVTDDFAQWDLNDLMYTPAGARFNADQLNIVSNALQEHHVLITHIPDVIVQKNDTGILYIIPNPGPRATFCCCNTKVIPHICVYNSTRTCSMSGGTCGMGSQVCP